MRFWYLLGVFSKISDEHPVIFLGEYPPRAAGVSHFNILFANHSRESFYQPYHNTKVEAKRFGALKRLKSATGGGETWANVVNIIKISRAFRRTTVGLYNFLFLADLKNDRKR